MEWPWTVAIPFGSLVIVTGPTVIGPLLRRIRVERNLHTVLEAEAVLIDPIGAILAVVALEMVLAQEMGSAARGLLGIPTRLVFGTLVGAALGYLMAQALASHRLIPRGLESVFTLALLLVMYAGCEAVLPESGIMAAPIAGMVVGNTPAHPSQELKEFKEQLTVLLVGLLFVLLAADVRLGEVTSLGWRGVATVGLLMLVVRPLAVGVSTAGSAIEPRGRAFLAWLGPRGIVAAAVASLFADQLVSEGIPEGIELRALVFLVIAATVVIQGLGGGLVARLLGVRRRSDTGYVIAGANPVARALGSALRSAGEEVVLLDTDRAEIAAGQASGLESILGNALDDEVLQSADVEGRHGIIALIPNEAVSLMVAEKARRELRVGRADVAVRPGRLHVTQNRLHRLGGRILFGGEADLSYWGEAIGAGRALVRRFRYTGDGERAVMGDGASAAQGSRDFLYLTVERRGRAAPVNDLSRLRRGDIVTALAVGGAGPAPDHFEAID
jgi:NhaP-type Na+/H+ or K+/H+ antiporter